MLRVLYRVFATIRRIEQGTVVVRDGAELG